jgi:hypothetical protein
LLVRIVPNYSVFRKRNRFGLQTYEPLLLTSYRGQSGCRRPFSEGQTRHICQRTQANKRQPENRRSFLLGGFCIWRYQQRKLECKVFANNAAIHQSDVF